MRRSGSRTMLLIGALVALAVFLVVYVLMVNGQKPATDLTPTPTVTPILVVVPKENGLQPNKIITDADVQLTPVDGTTVSTTTLKTTDQVVGKMVNRAYAQGTPIVSELLKEPGVAQRLTQGSRAFSIALREINTFNQGINDGDAIDVLWSKEYDITGYVQPPTGGAPEKVERKFSTTKTLLQNIKVLKVVSLKVGADQTQGSTGPVNASGGGNSSASDQQKAQQAIQQAYEDTAPYSMVLILLGHRSASRGDQVRPRNR